MQASINTQTTAAHGDLWALAVLSSSKYLLSLCDCGEVAMWSCASVYIVPVLRAGGSSSCMCESIIITGRHHRNFSSSSSGGSGGHVIDTCLWRRRSPSRHCPPRRQKIKPSNYYNNQNYITITSASVIICQWPTVVFWNVEVRFLCLQIKNAEQMSDFV